MNKFLILFFIICAFIFYSCKKSSSSPTVTKSQWTINGKTYTGDTTFFDYSNFDLESEDTAQNYAIIFFHDRPITNGTFTIVDINSFTDYTELDSNQCAMITGHGSDLTTESGTNANGGTVSVKISGGKLNASFANVKVSNIFNGDSTTFSGTLIEK
jgi:hypothetical protein